MDPGPSSGLGDIRLGLFHSWMDGDEAFSNQGAVFYFYCNKSYYYISFSYIQVP